MTHRTALATIALLAATQAATTALAIAAHHRHEREAAALIRIGERMARRACCPS